MAQRLPGHRIGCDLRPGYYGPGNTIPCNLGVDDGYEPPPPPEPPYRGIRSAEVGLVWGQQQRADVRAEHVLPFGGPQPIGDELAAVWRQRQVADVHADTLAIWRRAERVPTPEVAARWGRGAPTARSEALTPWQRANVLQPPDTLLAWGVGVPGLRGEALTPWSYPPRKAAESVLPWRGRPRPEVQRETVLPWRMLLPLVRRTWTLPWGWSRGLPWIVRPPRPPVPPPAPPVIGRRLPGNRIGADLGCPIWTGPASRIPVNLGFAGCWNLRRRRRSYVVINELAVVRLPDRVPVHVTSIDIDGSRDEWAHSLRMSLRTPQDLELIRPPSSGGPRRIEVTINGYVWVFAIEQYSRARDFAAYGASVTGRTPTALLSEPWAPARALVSDAHRLIAQLAADELDPWPDLTLLWSTVDWVVPAGWWSYASMTPMAALVRLAEAAGAVVQSDRDGDTVRVRPRYPVSPWFWSSTMPDQVLVEDLIEREDIRVQDRPLYDEVVITGEQGTTIDSTAYGVIDTVHRAGSPRETPAPQITDGLTGLRAEATQERGRNILSDRGRQHAVDVRTLLFPAPVGEGQIGLLEPLTLVRVEQQAGPWLGLVDSYRISVTVADDGTVTVWQTGTLLRHLSDAG